MYQDTAVAEETNVITGTSANGNEISLQFKEAEEKYQNLDYQVVENKEEDLSGMYGEIKNECQLLMEQSVKTVIKEHNIKEGHSKFAPLQVQTVLLKTEHRREIDTGVQYNVLYESYIDAQFSLMGFQTMDEWVSTFLDMNDGRMSQVYRIAIRITPWIMENSLVVNREAVDNEWFLKGADRKCRVSRARNFVSLLITTIESGLELEDKKEKVEFILAMIANPNLTNTELREAANNDGNQFNISATFVRNDDDTFNVLFNKLTGEEVNFLTRKTSKFITYNEE